MQLALVRYRGQELPRSVRRNNAAASTLEDSEGPLEYAICQSMEAWGCGRTRVAVASPLVSPTQERLGYPSHTIQSITPALLASCYCRYRSWMAHCTVAMADSPRVISYVCSTSFPCPPHTTPSPAPHHSLACSTSFPCLMNHPSNNPSRPPRESLATIASIQYKSKEKNAAGQKAQPIDTKKRG